MGPSDESSRRASLLRSRSICLIACFGLFPVAPARARPISATLSLRVYVTPRVPSASDRIPDVSRIRTRCWAIFPALRTRPVVAAVAGTRSARSRELHAGPLEDAEAEDLVAMHLRRREVLDRDVGRVRRAHRVDVLEEPEDHLGSRHCGEPEVAGDPRALCSEPAARLALNERIDHERDHVDLGERGEPPTVLEVEGCEPEIALETMQDVFDDVLVVIALEHLEVGPRVSTVREVARCEHEARRVRELLGEEPLVLAQLDGDDPHGFGRANLSLLRAPARTSDRTCLVGDVGGELVESGGAFRDALPRLLGVGLAVVGLRDLGGEPLVESSALTSSLLLERHLLLPRESRRLDNDGADEHPRYHLRLLVLVVVSHGDGAATPGLELTRARLLLEEDFDRSLAIGVEEATDRVVACSGRLRDERHVADAERGSEEDRFSREELAVPNDRGPPPLRQQPRDTAHEVPELERVGAVAGGRPAVERDALVRGGDSENDLLEARVVLATPLRDMRNRDGIAGGVGRFAIGVLPVKRSRRRIDTSDGDVELVLLQRVQDDGRDDAVESRAEDRVQRACESLVVKVPGRCAPAEAELEVVAPQQLIDEIESMRPGQDRDDERLDTLARRHDVAWIGRNDFVDQLRDLEALQCGGNHGEVLELLRRRVQFSGVRRRHVSLLRFRESNQRRQRRRSRIPRYRFPPRGGDVRYVSLRIVSVSGDARVKGTTATDHTCWLGPARCSSPLEVDGVRWSKLEVVLIRIREMSGIRFSWRTSPKTGTSVAKTVLRSMRLFIAASYQAAPTRAEGPRGRESPKSSRRWHLSRRRVRGSLRTRATLYYGWQYNYDPASNRYFKYDEVAAKAT